MIETKNILKKKYICLILPKKIFEDQLKFELVSSRKDDNVINPIQANHGLDNINWNAQFLLWNNARGYFGIAWKMPSNSKVEK